MQIQTRQRGNCSTLAGKSRGETPFCRTLKIVFSRSHSFIVSCKTLFLGIPPESGSARLGHIPSLPWESQLPLKPCISLHPSDFEGNCDSSDFLLDFCFISWCSFDLLRKCGLLAHTSAAFLKNCCTEKLLFACGSLPAALYIFPLQKRAGRTALLFLMLHLHLFDFSVQSNL